MDRSSPIFVFGRVAFLFIKFGLQSGPRSLHTSMVYFCVVGTLSLILSKFQISFGIVYFRSFDLAFGLFYFVYLILILCTILRRISRFVLIFIVNVDGAISMVTLHAVY